MEYFDPNTEKRTKVPGGDGASVGDLNQREWDNYNNEREKLSAQTIKNWETSLALRVSGIFMAFGSLVHAAAVLTYGKEWEQVRKFADELLNVDLPSAGVENLTSSAVAATVGWWP